MKFVYKAKRGLKDIVRGSIEAASRSEALDKLAAQNLFPITVEEERSRDKARSGRGARKRFILSLRRQVSQGEVLVFARKLSTLIRAKVELLSALQIIYDQSEQGLFRQVVLEIYNSTREGEPFSGSLRRFPRVFSPLFVSIIRSGETSGSLGNALEQITDFLSQEAGLRSKVSVALAYPCLLLVVGLASIFVLINFVIPRLGPIFADMGKGLPLVTRIILRISAISQQSWWAVLGVVGVLLVFLYSQKGNRLFNYLVRAFKVRFPIIKRMVKDQELVHFSRSLGLLLKSGVPALVALETAVFTVEDARLRGQLHLVRKELASGGGLSQSMETFTGLPAFFTRMVSIGERSGRLSEVLEELADSYSRQVEADIALVSSLIEPIMILVLGVVLGTIVLSVLIPTFQITQMVQ
ncbi:MAG: type II secretion system F family protein [Candidatus Omnitrophota bacterium]